MSFVRGDMIDYLNDLYPGWRQKLEKMSYDQVQAIYIKYTRRAENASRIKALILLEKLRPRVTDFYCTDCARYLEADNPELQECRFCGSRNIRRIQYD